MDNKKDDSYYIAKTIEDIDIIIDFTKGCSYEDFESNSMLIDAVMFRLIQMVENIKHISNGYKELHKEIAWGEIMGFRNGIVHEYGKTDYSIVYGIITEDIIELKERLLK